MSQLPVTKQDHSNCLDYRKIAAVFVSIVILVSVVTVPMQAQQSTPQINWDGFKFLMGEWVGEGTGAPGEGTGGFTFSFELQNTILVRKNYANYPATKDRPAFRHDDLMVVYQEMGKTKAVYFDNEQHVINYSVSLSNDSNSVVFVSDAIPSAPRFRLTNTKAGMDKITITFEMAPPGKPESFTRYIEAAARRKK
jgi:hypothetical protein